MSKRDKALLGVGFSLLLLSIPAQGYGERAFWDASFLGPARGFVLAQNEETSPETIQQEILGARALPRRTLYILHGGMDDPNNDSPTEIRAYLLNRGVKPEDILLLPDPYPAIPPALGTLPNLTGDQKAKKVWGYLEGKLGEAVTNSVKNWDVYKESAALDSTVTQTTYQALLTQLQEQQKQHPDEALDLVWIGLSAGGQLGLTMAEKFAKESPQFPFQTVVTLGSPILRNNAPRYVRIVSCISDQDQLLFQTTRPGYAKLLVGSDIFKFPPNLDENDEVRTIQMKLTNSFDPMEGHNLWHRSPEVLSEALQGIVP